MTKQGKRSPKERSFSTLIMLLFFIVSLPLNAKVSTYKDANGWKLKVDGNDYYVKGIVWGYTPIGENYSYNLWNNTDEQIKKVLDYECTLMKNAGINTIRSFGLIPPKWVTYIYKNYQIMTMINHLMGRYGYNIDGVWKPQTNYQDQRTREVLKRDILETVRKYKDVPGVIMFALGNESNYGLEWSSFEIENLPEGERHKEKAKHLYSLFNEIIKAGKELDSNHLWTIVNGDIQYLDLIVNECKDLDVLGINAYRGISFTDMWERVHKELDLPVMLTEFGSDAFNVLTNEEDQEAQAALIKGNWEEIYRKSYGKGEEGNAVGGCLFEWRDEWWKYLQTENLSTQETHASWSNGGYSFDYRKGVNNMNEEWFGICRLNEPNSDGVYVAEPRSAYFVMKEIWAIDPYQGDMAELNKKLSKIDFKKNNLIGESTLFKSMKKKQDKFSFTGGRLQGDLVFNGLSSEVEDNGKDGLEFSNGEMLFLDFKFQPTNKISGNLTLNILGNVPDKGLEEYYGKRGETYTTVSTEVNDDGLTVLTEKSVNDNERVEIYNFKAKYSSENYDVTAFYHIPRYHWKYKGDFFGLLGEATDMEGMDIWDAKAPYGVEISGNKEYTGMKLVVGPEIYWGANPKAIAKVPFHFGPYNFAIVHSEDFARAKASSTATEATKRATRQTSLYGFTKVIPRTKLEVGYLISGSEKIDEAFTYTDKNEIYEDKIDFEDTQSIKAKATIETFKGTMFDISATYAGLVANAGESLVEFNTKMPYSSLGNKMVFESGLIIPVGDYMILPRAMYRENLISANQYIEPEINGSVFLPGITPRNLESDPFAVLSNRKTIAGELYFTFDPTPASNFYAWDVDKREDADIAYTIGATYISYKKPTDSEVFYYQAGKVNAPFGVGFEAEDLWLASTKVIMNPNPEFKLIASLGAGKGQSTGNPNGGSREYFEFDTKLIFNKKHIVSGYIKKDSWGPLDWYRQFNITYPYQFMLDYSFLIDNFLDEDISSKFGIKGILRTLDENSPANEYEDGNNDYIFQIGAYYKFEF